MYLEHLINKVLAITTTHLFTSSQLSFSKHAFLCGVWVEEGGSLGPLGGVPAAVGTAHLHGALQSCLGLPAGSFLWPLGLLPPTAKETVARVAWKWRKSGQKSGVPCCVTMRGLPALSGLSFPSAK